MFMQGVQKYNPFFVSITVRRAMMEIMLIDNFDQLSFVSIIVRRTVIETKNGLYF